MLSPGIPELVWGGNPCSQTFLLSSPSSALCQKPRQRSGLDKVWGGSEMLVHEGGFWGNLV